MLDSKTARPFIPTAVRIIIPALFLLMGACLSKPESSTERASDVSKDNELPQPFEHGDLWGYRYADGAPAIAPQFIVAQPFSQDGIAAAANRESWWIIDRQGRKLLKPFLFDNGPDPFHEGLARFVQDGLIGYYNPQGEAVIAARYDGAEPFHDGRARVCLGCRTEKDGDYKRWVGGEWFPIDRTGNRLP